MITAEIKIHDEPQPSYTVQTHVQNTYYPSGKTKEEWDELCWQQLEKAKSCLKIGDTIEVNNPTQNRLIITGYVDHPDDMQKYQGMPCVVKGHNVTATSPNVISIQYSLPELNFSTLIIQENEDVE